MLDHARAEGIYVAGVRYVVAGGAEQGIYARKVQFPSHRLPMTPSYISHVHFR